MREDAVEGGLTVTVVAFFAFDPACSNSDLTRFSSTLAPRRPDCAMFKSCDFTLSETFGLTMPTVLTIRGIKGEGRSDSLTSLDGFRGADLGEHLVLHLLDLPTTPSKNC